MQNLLTDVYDDGLNYGTKSDESDQTINASHEAILAGLWF